MRAIGLWAHDRHRLVIGVWIALVIGTGALSAGAGGEFVNNLTLPGTESQRAYNLLKERFPQQSGDTSQIVFHVDKGTLNEKRARIESTIAKVKKQPTVAMISDPLAPGAGTVSKDGRTAFATITHDGLANDLDLDGLKKVVKTARAGAGDGLRVELGGAPIVLTEQAELPLTELLGVAVAAVVLFLVLGSLSAMVMPLIAAFVAIFIGSSLIALIAAVTDVADFATTLAVLISLGVGIDYGLLIINRFRNERAKGHEIRDAVGSAVDTAGRSVLFAGITVVIALCGMLLLGVGLLNMPAVGSAIGVTLTMLTSLTLVPALLGSRLGRRVKVGDLTDPDKESRGWARYSRFIERHPRKLALAALAVLLIVSSPMLGMRMGSPDAGNGSASNTSRQAYDLLSKGFGPGFNGPFLAAVELPKQGATAALARLERALKGDAGVASVAPAVLSPAKDTATIVVTPTSKPQDAATQDTLERLRDVVAPPVERSTGAQVNFGGATATTVDLAEVLSSKLPIFIAVVVGLSLLLLMTVFRSVVIPLKAGLLNLLSISAALGVVTFVFQDGHFASLIGIDSTGPIVPFIPVLMFAIIFGLSMDYEVFLVTRMHEEWEHTKDAGFAVRHGLALTGKVVTAAALVMISVFSAFMLSEDAVIKLFGLGFAAAILFDAFVIRLVLVPALMYLFGRASWWLPHSINRRLPVISIEGPDDVADEAAPA